jgi:hypothetical protein
MLSLVKDGKPLAAIVISDADPALPVRFAAEELQRYIKKMSRAELPVKSGEPSGPAIVLQVSPELHESEDAHQLKTEGDQLRLTGSSPRAVLYAAYLVLECLGCSFCVPDEETIPKMASISAPDFDQIEIPAFPYRSQVDFPFTESPLGWNIALIDWLAKNRFNWYHPAPNAYGEPTVYLERRDVLLKEIRKRGLHLHVGGHTLHTWLPPEKYSAEHPEYFALLRNGRKWERTQPLICVSNPEVHRIIAENICIFLDKCPEVEAVDCWEADVSGFCECPQCQQIGSGPRPADEEVRRTAYMMSYVKLIETVAGVLKESHPHVKLTGSVYAPGGVIAPLRCPQLPDNVNFITCHIGRNSYVPMQESPTNIRLLTMDISWKAKTEVTIYEYYNSWTNSGIYPCINVMAEDLRLLRQLGITRMETDEGGWNAVNLYALAKLMWNPELDWQELIVDFCRRHYGEAADAMTEYWLGLEHGLRGKWGYFSDLSGSKQYLLARKDSAIKELEALRDSAQDPVTKDRLRRELLPWEHFSEREFLRYSLPDPWSHHWPPGAWDGWDPTQDPK